VNLSLQQTTWILLGIALLVSSAGFYRTVYFISVGYAFSIAAMAIIAPHLRTTPFDWLVWIQSAGLFLWGIRLGIYVIRREFQSSYRNESKVVDQYSTGTTLLKKIVIWIGVSILYVAMFSPVLFGLTPSATPTTLRILIQMAGLIVLIGGLILEAVADRQKSAFKAHFPKEFCNVGLYQWVRCPNYLGEMMVWVGSWTMGIAIYSGPLQWVISTIGMLILVLIMLGSARRLELTQDSRYGSQDRYQEYVKSVPVILPFVPLYSLKKLHIYLQ